MQTTIVQKIREQFAPMAIYKDPASTNSLFAGRNLPSFVKDFILKRYIDETGVINRQGLTNFLDMVIPERQTDVKDRLDAGEELTLLARFIIYIDLIKGIRRFGIPDLGIKINEGQIPEYVYRNHRGELVHGEKWGIIKLSVLPDEDGKRNHVEMVDYKPFKPYRSVDVEYLRTARTVFSTHEWIDVLLSAMEYEADGFNNMTQKIEFLTRLLIFVEPRLNVIELAPKGTGKSFIFGNLSKYGWLVSGGKVTRAKLFYDKQKQQNGIIKNHDFVAFDEIQTIIFQEPAEIQAALKSYLEPLSYRYFDSLPQSFRESALLDRFHCFIEGWYLPRINKGIVYKGWTINVEYFSEILHALRTQNIYDIIFDEIVGYDRNADTRDFNAVKRIAVGYMKLLFPHWTHIADVNIEEFNTYCLQPAIRRRGIVKEQCHYIDPEFKTAMPNFWIKTDMKEPVQLSAGVEEDELF